MTSILSNISPISQPGNSIHLDNSANKMGLKTSEVTRLLESQKSSSKLSIPDLFFGDEGAFEIAKYLKENKNFTSIELRGNNISSHGFEAICESLKDSSSLKKISAEWNNIGSENLGLIALHELLEFNKSITSVDLRNNHIGPQCAGTISNIIRDASSLKSLDLRWNELGDEGAKLILLSLKESSNKVQIDLTGNKVSQELLLEISSVVHERSSQRQESISQTSRKDDYKPSSRYTEQSTRTPERNFSSNKENYSTENFTSRDHQKYKQERFSSIERSAVLQPSTSINITPLSKSQVLKPQLPITMTPLSVVRPRPTYDQSVLMSNRLQTAPSSILKKSYIVGPQYEPETKKPAGYNPEADLKEIQARYEQEAREVQEKYQAHTQAHLRMTKVINDLEKYSEIEKVRADQAEAKVQELLALLEAETARRQEFEANCAQLTVEVQTRDHQIQELSLHLEQFGKDNNDLKGIIEELKTENAYITQEYNAKMHEAEGRYNQNLADLSANNETLKIQYEKMQEDFQHQIHTLHVESETILRDYEEKIKNATMATAELAEELKKQENYIHNLQVENEEILQRTIVQIREEEHQKTEKIAGDLEREIRSIHGEYEKVSIYSQEVVRDLQNLEKQRQQQEAQFVGEINRVKDENAQLITELHVLSATIEKYKDELTLKNGIIIRVEGENENLKLEINRTKDHYADQIERIKRDFDFERKKLENNEKELRRKISDLEKELHDTKIEVQRVTREYERLGDMLKGNITKLISQTFSDYAKSGTPSQSFNDL